jgi:hypothetical protein
VDLHTLCVFSYSYFKLLLFEHRAVIESQIQVDTVFIYIHIDATDISCNVNVVIRHEIRKIRAFEDISPVVLDSYAINTLGEVLLTQTFSAFQQLIPLSFALHNSHSLRHKRLKHFLVFLAYLFNFKLSLLFNLLGLAGESQQGFEGNALIALNLRNLFAEQFTDFNNPFLYLLNILFELFFFDGGVRV